MRVFARRELPHFDGWRHRGGGRGRASGLLYHYFASKDEVLEDGFPRSSGASSSNEQVEAADEPADEKLLGIVKILLRTWRNDLDLVTVTVREVGRSAHLVSQVEDIGKGFAVIQRVIEQGQTEAVFREELDARLASWSRLRRARGDPHGLGDGQAPRRATRRTSRTHHKKCREGDSWADCFSARATSSSPSGSPPITQPVRISSSPP